MLYLLMYKIPKFQLRVPREPNEEANSIWPEPYARLYQLKQSQNFGNKYENEDTKKYPRDTLKPLVWTRLLRSVTTVDILSPQKSTSRNNPIINNQSTRSTNKKRIRIKKNNYSPISNLNDIIELTTFVKGIRRRYGRVSRTMMHPSNEINPNIKKRFKRSITINDSMKNNNDSSEAIPSIDKLHRHPEQSYENKKSPKVSEESVDIAKANHTDVNEFTDFYKRIWDIINGTRPRFKIVVPPVRTPTGTQTVSFKDEHAVAASEIEDLNLPYNMNGSLNVRDRKLLDKVPFDERKPSDELGRYVKAEVEGIEVPSDQLNNCKHNDDLTDDTDDVYNTDKAKEADDQTADSPDENFNHPYDKTVGESLNEKKDSSEFNNSTLLTHEKLNNENSTNEEQSVYDPENIPYVEIPDYEDEREESLDEEDRRRAKERHVNLVNISNTYPNFVEATKTIDSTNSNNKKEYEKDDGTRMNSESRHLIRNDNTRKKLESPDNLEGGLNNTNESNESNMESVLSTIHFDIDEYKKPFKLDEFLKNEPFFAKFTQGKEYAPESSENDEVKGGNDSYEFKDNVSVDFADADKQKPRYYVKEEPGSEEIINEDLYRYGDKNLFKLLSEENRKKRDSFEMSAEEKDFLDRYFTKDVIKKLKEDSEEELHETREIQMKEKLKNKKDMLKTLSSILEKKDRISRLDEAVNKEVEDGKNTPSVYKNYWSLEYELPGKSQSSN